MSNKDFLYSTGNHTQYFVITYEGKESGDKKTINCVQEKEKKDNESMNLGAKLKSQLLP